MQGLIELMTNTCSPSTLESFDPQKKPSLRAVLLAAIEHLASLLLLSGFTYAGAVPVRLFVLLLSMAALAGLFSVMAVTTGYSKRFRDPTLARFQALTMIAIQLTGLWLAPQIAYLFVANLLIPLACGALHFQRRMQFVALLLLAASAITMFKVEAESAVQMAAQAERNLLWLLAAISAARLVAINACISDLRRQLQERNEELRAATQRLAELASRDELTGLWNRREFMRLMQEESRRAVRSRSHFCIAVIDVDFFKQINQQYGHLGGDAVLQEMAQLLDLERRATDSVARYDGKQFSLLLMQARLSTAMVATERLRHQVMRHEWNKIAPGLQLTISAGVAEWKPGETMEQLLNRAQAVLSEAKAAGRNCVRAALDVALV